VNKRFISLLFVAVACVLVALTALAHAQTFPPASGSGAVSSVFGRTGVVAATAGDYTASQITGAVLPDLLSESRPVSTLNYAAAKGTSVAASATTTILSYSGSGYVSDFWMGLSYSDSASATASTLTITTDSITVFNDRLPLFFGGDYLYNTVNYASKLIGGQTNGSNNVGYYSYIAIPFGTSISITLTNGSSGSAATVWYTIGYQTGISGTYFPREYHLHCASGTIPGGTLSVNTTATLINATSLNPGRLIGVYMSIDSGCSGCSANPSTAGLEGRVKYYLDGAGTPTYQSSGTEDFFHWSGYFEGGGGNGHTGTSSWDFGYTGLQYYYETSPVTWNAYRFHVRDPVFFSNALEITWDAGYSTVVNYSGSYRLAYTVWYYTQ
jgi:hypothetical protein